MIALLLSLARGAELDLRVGYEQNAADPFLVRRGLRVSAEVQPVSWFGVGVAAAEHPDLGALDHTGRTVELTEAGIWPDLSRVMESAGVWGAVTPVRARSGGWSTSVGAYGGVGVVHTVDDGAELFQDDADFAATVDQVHLASIVGLRGEARREHLTLQVRLERQGYREEVFDVVEESKNDLYVGLDVGYALDLSPRRERRAPERLP